MTSLSAMSRLSMEPVDPQLLPFGLRAIKTALSVDGPLHPTQRAMIDLAQRLLLHSNIDLDTLPPITPQEVAARLPRPEQRTRLVRAMLVASLVRGEVSRPEAETIATWARALEVDEPAVAHLRRVADGDLLMLRLDVNRRAFTGQAIKDARESEGLLPLLRSAASRLGLAEDEATIARYETLASYGPGTLGRELWDYYVRNQFPIPGRKHALPPFAVVHDLCHVLSGYGVDGEGEIEVVSFQSGFMRRDPLSTIFFIVLQSHLGVRLVQIAPGRVHALDDPALLERAMRAAHRGTQVNRDLFDHWDYWPELAQPIADVRRRLNILPPDAEPARPADPAGPA